MKNTESNQAGKRTQHTPGPWEFEIPSTSHHAIVTSVDGDWPIATVSGAGKKTELPQLHAQGIANARLIAAAPELLEVLHEITATIEANACEYVSLKWIFDKAHAAISKAEGK